jgi:hypothetical protein
VIATAADFAQASETDDFVEAFADQVHYFVGSDYSSLARNCYCKIGSPDYSGYYRHFHQHCSFD